MPLPMLVLETGGDRKSNMGRGEMQEDGAKRNNRSGTGDEDGGHSRNPKSRLRPHGDGGTTLHVLPAHAMVAMLRDRHNQGMRSLR